VVALEIENTASKYGVKTAWKQGRNLRGFTPYFDAVFRRRIFWWCGWRHKMKYGVKSYYWQNKP
jgi:hypothetical protein